MSQIQVPSVPQLFKKGLYPDNSKMKKTQQIFVDLSILLAKKSNNPLMEKHQQTKSKYIVVQVKLSLYSNCAHVFFSLFVF